MIGGTGRENITIQGCISAIGQLLPPYILYSGQRLMFDYTQGGPAGTRYGVSQKGWMTEVNFIDWFRNLFIPSLPDERPVMLIFDGHETHMNYEVRQLALKHDIVIAKIPPHTTHLLQPLDLAVFKPLKEAYDRFAHLLFISERRYVTKRDFPDLVAKTWKAFKPQFARNGFKKAGIVPFCRNAIDIQSLAPSNPFVGNPLQDLLVNENDTSSESESDGDNGESITELLGNEIDDISANIIPIYSSPTIATLPCLTSPTLPTECSVTIQSSTPTITEPSSHTTVVTPTIIDTSPNIIPISHIPSTPPIPIADALPTVSPNLPTSSTTTITELSSHTTVATPTIIDIPSTPPIPIADALPTASPNLPTSSTTTITEPSSHTTVATPTIIDISPNIIPISHIPSTPPIPIADALPTASPNLPTSSTTTITEPSSHTTVATPTSSSLQQSSNQSTGVRDFFLQYKTTPHRDTKGRSKRLASLGESLTAEDALERQKNNEDEKKRREKEKRSRERGKKNS